MTLDLITRIGQDFLTSPTTITIEADTDANGSGTIDFQTRGVTRLQITNTGTLDVTVPTSGSIQAIRMKTNEAGSGDFAFSYFATAGNAGETRRDNQLVWGYNPGGPGNVADEHSFVEAIESRYNTAEDILQVEHYFQYDSGIESAISLPGVRPFSITIGLVSGDVAIDNMADSVRFWDKFFTGDGAGSPYFRMDMDDTEASFRLEGNSQIAYDGTDSVFLTNNGANYLYQIEDLSGNKRLKFFDGSGGASGSDYLNVFAATNTAEALNQVLIFGQVASGSTSRSIRWNGTTQQFEYQHASYLDSGVTTFRPLNDWAPQIRHYGLTRSLGDDAGDYIELGTIVDASSNEDGNFEIEVFSEDLRTYKRFVITKTDGDASGTWLEVIPSISGPGITDAGDVAVDIKNAGTGGHNLRLRRTVATAYGAQTYTVALRIFDKFNGFSASSGSGASATVAGTYRWIPLMQTPTGLYFWDGNSMELISVGASGSGGTGFRALVIPN